LATSGIGIAKTDDKKIDLWVNGRNELYTLEAKTKLAKENFATVLRKVISKQMELFRTFDRGINGVQQQVCKVFESSLPLWVHISFLFLS